MGKNIGLLGILAAVIAGLVWLVVGFLGEPSSDAAAVKAHSSAPTQEPRDESALAPAGGRAEPEAVEQQPAEPQASPTEPVDGSAQTAPVVEEEVTVRGKVCDARGEPVAGVAVGTADRFEQAAPSAASAITQNDGGFSIVRVPSDRQIIAVDDLYETVRSSRVTSTNWDRDHVIVVAPVIELAGRVVDPSGGGLAEAELRVSVPVASAEFPYPLDMTQLRSWRARSGQGGEFEFARVPRVDGAQLSAQLIGYERSVTDVPPMSKQNLVVELRPQGQDTLAGVSGLVVHADGEAAVGAGVHLGFESTVTDEFGRFALSVEWVPDGAPLAATLEGFQPALIADFAARYNESNGKPGPVRLTLGEETLAIAGVVVDAAGEPQRNWRVELLDGTEISRDRVPVVLAEHLSSGGSDQRTTTGRDGAFQVEGLSPRPYKLRVWNPKTLVQLDTDPVAAGRDDVRVVVPADATVERVAGRVINARGVPLEKVRVSMALITQRTERGMATHGGGHAFTDADGRFEFRDVPVANIVLSLRSESVMPASYELAEERDLEALEFVVAERCHFRVINAARGEGFWLVNQNDERVSLHTLQSNSWSSSSYVALVEGQSHVVSAPEGQYAVVLVVAGEELERRPLALAPGEVVEVRFED